MPGPADVLKTSVSTSSTTRAMNQKAAKAAFLLPADCIAPQKNVVKKIAATISSGASVDKPVQYLVN